MKQPFVHAFLLVAAQLFLAACSDVTGLSDKDPRRLSPADDTMLHLTGEGLFVAGTNPDLVLNALKTFKGNVSGNAILPGDGGKFGDIIEVVAPSATHDHWCVNVPHPEVDGLNVLIYIRDVGDGRTSFDEFAIGGDFGASCATHPAPDLEFASFAGGDFKGAIRTR